MIRDNRKPKPKPRGPKKADPNARRRPESDTPGDGESKPVPPPKRVRLAGRRQRTPNPQDPALEVAAGSSEGETSQVETPEPGPQDTLPVGDPEEEPTEVL